MDALSPWVLVPLALFVGAGTYYACTAKPAQGSIAARQRQRKLEAQARADQERWHRFAPPGDDL